MSHLGRRLFGGQSSAIRLLIAIGLPLFCLKASEAQSECDWARRVPQDLVAQCCTAEPEIGGLRPGEQDLMLESRTALGCLDKLKELVYDDQPVFPMQCCWARPYSKVCKANNYNPRRMNKLLKDSLMLGYSVDSDGDDDACPTSTVEECCENYDEDPRRTSLVKPKSIAELDKCVWELMKNIVKFEWKVPQVCCIAPIFSILCTVAR